MLASSCVDQLVVDQLCVVVVVPMPMGTASTADGEKKAEEGKAEVEMTVI